MAIMEFFGGPRHGEEIDVPAGWGSLQVALADTSPVLYRTGEGIPEMTFRKHTCVVTNMVDQRSRDTVVSLDDYFSSGGEAVERRLLQFLEASIPDSHKTGERHTSTSVDFFEDGVRIEVVLAYQYQVLKW